ncbi:MAG: hypothetical protein E7045_02315 [Lentisphaerae bacterium]|nr:hypothetical protein [Lentisphaerota bacterium]
MFKKSLIIATLVPFLQLFAAQAPFTFAPEEALLAGDNPNQNPQLRFDESKFTGKAFTIETWAAPGFESGNSDISKAGYRTIISKGNRARNMMDFTLQLYNFVPAFNFINPANGNWEGIMRYDKSLRTGKYGTRLVPLKDCASAVPHAWNHIAATFDNGNITTYLNGKVAARGTSRAKQLPLTNAPAAVGLGQGDGGGSYAFFNGFIAKISCYDRALSADEIKKIYETEKAKYPSGKIEIPSVKKQDFGNFSPDFSNKLELTKAFEKNLPPQLVEENTPVTVELRNGAMYLIRNGKIMPSMTASQTPKGLDHQTRASMRDFAAAGVPNTERLVQNMTIWKRGIHDWWVAPGKYDFSRIDNGIREALEANPQGRIMLRVKVDVPRWWANRHKAEAGVTADGKNDRFQPSFNSPSWRKDGTAALAALLKHIESQPYASRIYGYLIAGGRASEWYWWGTHHGCVDYSKCNTSAWRLWLKKRYKSVEALRKAWNDDTVDFETAQIPSPKKRSDVSELGFFRYPPKARDVIDYRLFSSDSVTDAMALFVKTAKDAVQRRKVIGVFYGYTLWHPHLERQGFHNLDKVLANPDIDFIVSPTSYDRRRAGMEGDFLNGYTASLLLHKKLYFDEADMRTCFCSDNAVYKTPTRKETVDVHWRTLGNALTQGTHLQWLTLAGPASFHDEELMQQFSRMAKIEKQYQGAPRRSKAEVALIVDEKSMVFVNDKCLRNHDFVRMVRSEVGHAGFAYDTYLYSDMFNPDMPDYKLYIFTNLWNAEKNIAQLHAKFARNKANVIWFYAPGFITYGGYSTKQMKRLTGFDFACSRRSGRKQLSVTANSGWTKYLKRDYEKYYFDPAFSVTSPGAEISGKFGELNALAAIDAPWGGKSFYSLIRPTADLLRGTAEVSNVHLYNKSGDLVRANESFVMLHAAGDGKKELVFDQEYQLTEIISGKKYKAKKLVFDLKNGETLIFHTEKLK